MERSVSEKIKLGIFVITGTVLLVVAAYLIGNRQNMFGQTFTVTTVFRNVNGLQKGNNVRYSGINVGTVQDIDMEQDTVIRVYMIIEEKMLLHIKKNAVATIGSDGLVGSMIVNIVPGEGPGTPVAPGDEIASFSRLSTNDMLSTLNVTNENAALLTADLLKVTHSLVNGKGTMGQLLNDSVMAEDLRQTLNNLKVASAEARTVIGELHESFVSEEWEQSVAGVLLTDSVSGRKVKTLLEHLEHSGEELAGTVQAMDSLVTGISRGEGAIHYLSQDTVFVNSLSRTMESIEEGAERFNENMEALKHNFLTRGYFRRLERQQAKDAKKEN